MKALRRIRYLFRQCRMERELAEEIEFHRALSREPRELGNITQSREVARAVWIWPWLQSVWQDVAYAMRSLRNQPGFTLVSLLALGTAIGLNTSLFTVFNTIALRPWEVKDPGRVVRVFTRADDHTGLSGLSIAEFRYLAERTRSFAGLMVLSKRDVRFGFEPFGKPSHGIPVASNHFRVLGADMHLGRGFLLEEDRTEAPAAVIVLSYALWRDHFGADSAILGKQVPVNSVPFTVVGVAPRSLTGLDDREDAWMPLPAAVLLDPAEWRPRDWLLNPDRCCEDIAGRLADGVSREQARAELEVLSSQFRSQFQFRSSSREPQRATFLLTNAKLLAGDADNTEFRQLFALMFLGVTLIVLLACASVGNLLVARAAARQREIEIRRAVGAGRARIVRQLLTESLVLALGASGIGVLLAFQLPAFVIAQIDDDFLSSRLTPDLTVLAYALGLAVFACICFGLAPALHGTRPTPARSRLRLRNLLLASQVALSVVLLTGAGLMLEGVRRVANHDLGFAVRDVTVTSFELPAGAVNQARLQAFSRQLVSDLRGLPNAAPFALALSSPLGGRFAIEYRLPEDAPDRSRKIDYQEASPGYFETLRIPLVAGRAFEPRDTGRPVAIVNETLARRWEGAQAVGKTILTGGPPRQVIGVARDTYSRDVDRIEPMLYQPFGSGQPPKVLVRSSTPGIAKAIEAMAAGIEPGTRAQTEPLSDNLNRRLAEARIGAEIAGVLGAFGLALATVGMFGVFAYAVQQRTKEIGIRMALGARPAQVIRLVLAGSSRAIVAGFGAGFFAAAAASRIIARYLYGVSPLDPRTYLLVAAILAAAAFAASYLPSHHAAKIDPLAALRHE